MDYSLVIWLEKIVSSCIYRLFVVFRIFRIHDQMAYFRAIMLPFDGYCSKISSKQTLLCDTRGEDFCKSVLKTKLMRIMRGLSSRHTKNKVCVLRAKTPTIGSLLLPKQLQTKSQVVYMVVRCIKLYMFACSKINITPPQSACQNVGLFSITIYISNQRVVNDNLRF